MVWRKAAVLTLALVFIAFSSVSLAAKGPASETAIKIFPGATVMADDDDQPEQGAHIRSAYKMRYGTQAMPEAVYAFYQKQFAAVPQTGQSSEPAPGVTTAVTRDVSYHTFEDFMEKGEGKKKKAALVRSKRKPLEPGKWIGVVYFDWVKKELNGDRTDFKVTVWDGGSEDIGTYRADTQITIERITYKSEQAMEDENMQADEAEHAAKIQSLSASSFNPADVGIPEYPGSKFDKATTDTLRSSMAVDTAAYRTGDSVQKVAEFYKKQRGLNLMGDVSKESAVFSAGCKEEYVAILKKKMVTGCDLQVGIQNPWMNMKTGKMVSDTLITITRQSN